MSVFAQKVVDEDISYSSISKHLESELLSQVCKKMSNTEPVNSANSYLETMKHDSSNLKANYGLSLILHTDYQQPESIYYIEKVN